MGARGGPGRGRAQAELARKLPPAALQMCACARLIVLSGACRTWFDVFTFETAPCQHSETPTSPSNHPHHPLDKRLERVHSAHLPVKVPPRVSCRLVTLGSVLSRTHCPQQLVFAQRYH